MNIGQKLYKFYQTILRSVHFFLPQTLEVPYNATFETKCCSKIFQIFPVNQFYPIKFRFWSNSNFLGLIEIGHFSQKKIFDNQCELFISYNLSVRKMKEVLLKNFLSIAKESTTFSMNTGPDFGVSCWTCHQERCIGFTLGNHFDFDKITDILNQNHD